MNNEIKFTLRQLTLLYYRFRYSQYFSVVMPVLMILTGLLVFILFILPQIENWFSIRSEVESVSAKINIMRQNRRTLESMNKFTIDTNFTTATKALPADKDFIGILHAISKSASESNTSLQDYEFSLGTVSLGKGNKKISPASLPIQVGLTLEGTINDMSQFLFSIERKLPVVEIKNANFSKNKGQVLLVFFVKPLPNLDIQYSNPLTGMKQEERNILQVLNQWSSQ